jgi:hypothetical protein
VECFWCGAKEDLVQMGPGSWECENALECNDRIYHEASNHGRVVTVAA